jgi:hypothetical protein
MRRYAYRYVVRFIHRRRTTRFGLTAPFSEHKRGVRQMERASN